MVGTTTEGDAARKGRASKEHLTSWLDARNSKEVAYESHVLAMIIGQFTILVSKTWHRALMHLLRREIALEALAQLRYLATQARQALVSSAGIPVM